MLMPDYNACTTTPLLEANNLTVRFELTEGGFDAVRRISFTVPAGQTLCLVGESGCGKTMTLLSVLRLTPPSARLSGDSLMFGGKDLLCLRESEMRRIRGRSIAMIFQEPMTSLNPVLRIGDQAAEPLITHLGLDKKSALDHIAGLFTQVGISEGKQRLKDYAHHLSGGMRQRVMIAMALSCDPSLLLADEPTTALDVTIQGQILALLKTQIEERGMGLLLITHDLGVVAEMADQVGVMYAGELVETAPVRDFFRESLHPYATGLKNSIPALRMSTPDARFQAIPGAVPVPDKLPPGCAFAPRCKHVMPRCAEPPPLFGQGTLRTVRCWLHSGSAPVCRDTSSGIVFCSGHGR
jgi:peptide/nickel transport system ATP-binding protein